MKHWTIIPQPLVNEEKLLNYETKASVMPAARCQLLIFQVLGIALPWSQQAFLAVESKQKNTAHKPRNSAFNGINFLSRLHVCIQQKKVPIVIIYSQLYSAMFSKLYKSQISYIMRLSQLSVINIRDKCFPVFSLIWSFCQANTTFLLFRALQEQ